MEARGKQITNLRYNRQAVCVTRENQNFRIKITITSRIKKAPHIQQNDKVGDKVGDKVLLSAR